ncbi:hypothetical protein OD917_01505 [Flavobacterium sp. SH_e]|uniref:hypothetical protein n=1 Tax=Flavobacterium TaxID=237 RepID=UPI0021E41227|nr:hypothetical protein [Flavobacterium sp. SH_e]MCV2483582.1 hypothetical protein [Flavobacterium sp. SH_e]
MKTILKTKIAFFILLIGLVFSCKKNETPTTDSYENDSIQNTMDTVGPEVDTINMDTTETIATDTIKK